MGTPDRFVAAGGVIVGLGGAFGVAYYIYSLENGLSFWSWQGAIALVSTGIGLFVLVAGLLRRNAPAANQQQRSGKESTNYQAGRDIAIGQSDDADR